LLHPEYEVVVVPVDQPADPRGGPARSESKIIRGLLKNPKLLTAPAD
jgi:hypothetical protein